MKDRVILLDTPLMKYRDSSNSRTHNQEEQYASLLWVKGMVYHFIHPVDKKNSIFVLFESGRHRGRSEADNRNIVVCFPSLLLTIPLFCSGCYWLCLRHFWQYGWGGNMPPENLHYNPETNVSNRRLLCGVYVWYRLCQSCIHNTTILVYIRFTNSLFIRINSLSRSVTNVPPWRYS